MKIINHVFLRIFGILLFLILPAHALANLTIASADIYYMGNVPQVNLSTDSPVINCDFYLNNDKKLSGFDIASYKVIMVGFNDTINNMRLQCWDINVTTSVSRTVYYHGWPISEWSLLLSPLALLNPIGLVVPMIPLIFYQQIPKSFLNDASFLGFCIFLVLYTWNNSLKPVLEKDKEGKPDA